MPFHELIAKDPQLSCYLFSEDDARDRRMVRPQYRPFICPRCAKVDELRALAQAGVPDIRFRSTRDIVSTADDFKLCSQRFIDGLAAAGITGLSFLPLPSQSGTFIVLPQTRAKVDETIAGIAAHGERCSQCARWRETAMGPLCQSIEKPADALAIFSPAVWPESVRGMRPLFFCTASAAKAISPQRFKGLELSEAF
jgi:hypothetical protein